MNMETPMENPWQTLSTRTVYDNPWISVTESQIINPGGGGGIYGVVHFKNQAIGIVPVDEQGGAPASVAWRGTRSHRYVSARRTAIAASAPSRRSFA